MSEWTPISLKDLEEEIRDGESRLKGKLLDFWRLVKIVPEKWEEKTYGKEGGGFWVVAICGKRVIWFNDIEDGFNISPYKKYGRIEEYYCDQDGLDEIIIRFFNAAKSDGQLPWQLGAPQEIPWL
jgi:hypothetical protein